MIKILGIGVGGAIGTLLRYAFVGYVGKQTMDVFPWGTLWVNAVGCFAAGFLWQLFEKITVHPDFRVFVFIGILGAFTTFSAYSLESIHLFRGGEIKLALLNMVVSNILCLVMIVLGFLSSKFVLGFVRG